MKDFTADEYSLHKILSSAYEFTIPDHQRPHAWGKERAPQRGSRYGELLKQLDKGDELAAAAFNWTPEELTETKDRPAERIYLVRQFASTSCSGSMTCSPSSPVSATSTR